MDSTGETSTIKVSMLTLPATVNLVPLINTFPLLESSRRYPSAYPMGKVAIFELFSAIQLLP